MAERFAVYCAPDPDSPLWRRAATWLGRDARRTADLAAEVPGISTQARRALTTSARRYGFHATLKAPFALAEGRDARGLEAAVAAFAGKHAPLPIGPVVLASLDGFLALVPERQSEALTGFAQACVEAFEPFRAPMPAGERQRRLQSPLTERQVDLLDRFGYPYVMEQFRFHMTLTDRLDPADAPAVTAAARDWFRPVIRAPLLLDGLSLFYQVRTDEPFIRVADFPLAGGDSAP